MSVFMPELPEVEVVRQGLEKVAKGQIIKTIKISRFDLRWPIPQDFVTKFSLARINKVLRRGKYILVFCCRPDKTEVLFTLHLGMSGRVRILKAGQQDLPQTHDHVEFVLQNSTRIIFNDARRFGFIKHLNPESWEKSAPFKVMGPEPLEPDFNAEYLQGVFKNREGPVKNALLNQSIISGIGNIYACEALFESGISPLRPCKTLQPHETGLLTEEIKLVLQKAIEAGGSTLRDHRQADGSLGYFQHHFRVYGRENMECLNENCSQTKSNNCEERLSDGIKRIVQAGRSTFYCEACQI